MKKILLTLLLLLTSNVFAQNYYVCDTGDDSSNGSEAAPFKTFPKGIKQFNKMEAGGSLLFCRGGEFPTADKYLAVFNPKCSASALCTIADYGDESKDRPYIVPQSVEAGFLFMDGGAADQDGGYVIRNLVLNSNNTTRFGFRILNDVDDLLIDNVQLEGFEIGIYLGAAGATNPGANQISERIVLRNSQIINNSGQGWLGGGDDVLIENNLFENNGSHAIFDHNIYLNSPIHQLPVTNMTIRGNTIYKSTQVDGKCMGTSLVAHGQINNLTIENNIVKEDKGAAGANCWGISVDPGYTDQEFFNNVVIKGNTVINMGGVAIGCASCNGAVIENNNIIDEAELLYYGISVPVRSEDNVKSKNVKISNNTIIISHDGTNGVNVSGVNVFTVKNNSISLPESSTAACIRKIGANANIDISSNICSQHTSITFTDTTTIDAQQAAAEAAAQQAAEEAAAQQAAEEAAAQQAAAEAAAQQAAAEAAAQQATDAAAQQAAADAAAQQAAAEAAAQQAAAEAADQQAAEEAAQQAAAAELAAQQAAAEAEAAAQQAAAEAAATTYSDYSKLSMEYKRSTEGREARREARRTLSKQRRSSLGSTSLSDVRTAGVIDYSSVDSRNCRASSATGRCLMY